MPQAAVAAIANFFLAATGAYSAAATAYALFAAKVFVYAAANYLLNRAAESMAPKARGAGLGAGMEINYFDTGAPIRIVYGQVRTGGMETIPPLTSGNDSKYLHKLLTLTGHEVDSYNFVHFDTTTITNAQIGAMSFTGSDGLVSSGYYGGKAWIRRYRGTSTDSADRMLISVDSAAFNNARGRGIAKTALTFEFDPDVYRSIPTVTVTYQGKRCYDPRLDPSPGASPTNPSYIAWTRNPALCLCDYLMAVFGGEYAATDIDWSSVVTAANYCDGVVSTPTGSQTRYTCNGVLMATDAFESNIRMLVDSMLGRIIFRDGKWRIYAGSWQTPTFTIEKEDWLEGGLSIRFEQGRARRFNRMKCWYVDPDRDWQRVECNPRYNPTYKTADGSEDIDTETEQLMCTGEYEAQRKTEFLLRQSRNQITVTGRLPPRFQDVALWDTGAIAFDHLGWSTKTFRCVGIDLNPDGSMDCVFCEEQSDDWTDMLSAEYDAPSMQPLPAVNSNPLVAVAQFWDRVNPDAEFTAATSNYWNWFPNSWSANIWSVSPNNQGTLFGGKSVLIANSMTSRPFIEGKRQTGRYPADIYPWRDGGPPANVMVRWRRTNSLYDANSATTNPCVSLDWGGSDGATVSKIIFQGLVDTPSRIYPNQFAANTWIASTFSAQPAPGMVQATMPRLTIFATSGQFEIDCFDARQL